jgi:uncharacterized protein (DUF302 family)
MRRLIFLALLFTFELYAVSVAAGLRVISTQTTLGPIEASSLIQAELQAQGFSVRFVQPVDKGLKKYNKQQEYLRIIVFDPPAEDIPDGAAGDALHAFIPLRIAITGQANGTEVSALPYAQVAQSLPVGAQAAMQRWGEVVRDIIEGLPDGKGLE